MNNIQNKLKHRWISPKANSFNSDLHGLGVIAIEDIQKGETVGVLGGMIVHENDIKQYWDEIGHIGIQISDDFFIVPHSRDELNELGVYNHSCNPNIGFKNSIEFVAIHNILKGVELVFDYAFNETLNENFECKCGSSECRGIITKDDWKIKSIQERNFDYFSPYLKEKINEKNKTGS